MKRIALLIVTNLAILFAPGVARGGVTSLFSSHPSSEERIAALQRG